MKPRHTLSILAATLLLTGCVTASPPPAHAPEPAACTDSLYVQLGRQHPDSLSERAWRRFQSLDSACAHARAETGNEGGMGMMGMAHGPGRATWVLVPLIVAGMVVMMLAFAF